MCFVKDLTFFSQFHTFGDLVLFFTTISVIFFAFIQIIEEGIASEVHAVTPKTYLTIMGFSIYTYEGIGISKNFT